MVPPPQNKIWQHLTKLYKHLPFDPENSFLGIYPNDTLENYERHMYELFTGVIYSSKNWKEPKYSGGV